MIRTKVVANPIPMAFVADVVTARVGHIPKTNLNVGFSSNIPSLKTFKIFILNAAFPLHV